MTPERIENIVFGSFSFQDVRELVWLCNILEKAKLRNVLEIGVAYGVSIIVWDKLVESEGFVVGVDTDGMARGFPTLRHFIEQNKKNIKLIKGYSEDPETLKLVKEYFPGRIIDFLFIDGNHEYQCVSRDYLTYGPLVRPGGIIALHDTNHSEVGVSRFWEELKSKNNLRIEEYKQSNGVGVIYVEN